MIRLRAESIGDEAAIEKMVRIPAIQEMYL
jgi:hypothetical protein